MKIKIKRIAKRDTYTIGRMYLNDKYFCDTLEDKDRGLVQNMLLSEIQKLKVHSKTAIPKGTYKVIVNRSPKFRRNLPRLLNVPGFTGILIHRGNTSKDSSGCILVGENKIVGKVINSTNYEIKLVDILTKHSGEETTITIE